MSYFLDVIVGYMYKLDVNFSFQTLLTAISMSAIATNGVVPGEVLSPSGCVLCRLI